MSETAVLNNLWQLNKKINKNYKSEIKSASK